MDEAYFGSSIVDLHIHTTESDGKKSVVEVLKIASKNNLAAIAITDHDTVSGIEVALNEAEKHGIEVVSGVELSVSYSPIMHILGLFIDYRDVSLNHHLQKIMQARMYLVAKAFRIIRNYGIDVSPQQVINSKYYLSLKSFTEYLLQNQLLKSTQEADSLLGTIWDEWRCCLPSARECIAIIHKCNGVAMLAHAKLLYLNDNELNKLIFELQGYGLDGVELIHPTHDIEYMKKLKRLADSLGLICSGGSDFHGKGDRNIMLSDQSWKTAIPYTFVENMKSILRRKI